MALNFGEWVVKVAVNGVKAGSFDREWAALQLANHYVRGKITELDLVSFETAVDEYEAELQRAKEEAEKQAMTAIEQIVQTENEQQEEESVSEQQEDEQTQTEQQEDEQINADEQVPEQEQDVIIE